MCSENIFRGGKEKEMARLLLDRGALIDAKDTYGSTALRATVDRGNYSVVALLLARGAAVDEPDNYHCTPSYTERTSEDG